MYSIAEVMTPDATLYYRFDSTSEDDVSDMADILGDLADQGIVMGLGFYVEQ